MSILLQAQKKQNGHKIEPLKSQPCSSMLMIMIFIAGTVFGAVSVSVGLWFIQSPSPAQLKVNDQPLPELVIKASKSTTAEIILPKPTAAQTHKQTQELLLAQPKPQVVVAETQEQPTHKQTSQVAELKTISGKSVAQPVLQQKMDTLVVSEDVDAELISALQQALLDVEQAAALAKPVGAKEQQILAHETADNEPLADPRKLPSAIKDKIPSFDIEAHIYASSANQRWLKVNGIEAQQGDTILGNLNIVEIRPRDVVFAVEGYEFNISAIGGWPLK
ncbi:general secretion pathway protein GspB [Paraferrimonas sp. SM1919]|uniref:general secretion pathway protein GspB n=1 Tax=Paraferrimonas sp. SM1919 TaxID=2662263 RepID=UPI0013D6854A|nr:general secretion pathway protein GspB [Paraferrimonas sp. SM1919]